MPSDPHQFFIAMCTVQDYLYQYVQEAAHNFRDPGYQITFRMNDCFEKYEAPLKVAKDITPEFDYSGWAEKRRSEFTCFIDFDEAAFSAAKKISGCIGKHITEALRILYGATTRKWPILSPARTTEGKGILIINWGEMEEALKLQKGIGPHCDVVDLSEPITMEDIDLLDVDTASAVIGPVSAITYLAAAYHRKVIEIFPTTESYSLYNNEGIVEYQAIIGIPNAHSVKQAWDILSVETDLYV